MTVLTMSTAEVSRFDTLMRLDRGEIRVADAMALLSLERRQIYRLLERLRQDGAAGLISRKRGRPSNRRYADAFRDQVVSLVREQYNGFGPTLAREYLAERHGIRVSCDQDAIHLPGPAGPGEVRFGGRGGRWRRSGSGVISGSTGCRPSRNSTSWGARLPSARCGSRCASASPARGSASR